jgi:hypothetical protein
MILLAYIIIGHSDWKGAEISINAIFPEHKINEERDRLKELIEAGQLPISNKNITLIAQQMDVSVDSIIENYSRDADLCILGFREETVKHDGSEIFMRIGDIGNIMYVNASAQKTIVR